jgi:carboxylate-amine ligase
MSGRAPFILNWEDFVQFFDRMVSTGVVKSMKDFYWDIRPKPEFGTIEIRVCDTPLIIEIAAAIVCYIQSMSSYIMTEQLAEPEKEDDCLVYTFNRFQACRFGLEGVFIDPLTNKQRSLREEITDMLARIADHTKELQAEEAMECIREILAEGNGASWLRKIYARDLTLTTLCSNKLICGWKTKVFQEVEISPIPLITKT